MLIEAKWRNGKELKIKNISQNRKVELRQVQEMLLADVISQLQLLKLADNINMFLFGPLPLKKVCYHCESVPGSASGAH